MGPKELTHDLEVDSLVVVSFTHIILLIFSSSQKPTHLDFYQLVYDSFTFCFFFTSRRKLSCSIGGQNWNQAVVQRHILSWDLLATINHCWETACYEQQQLIFSHNFVCWLCVSTAGFARVCSKGCIDLEGWLSWMVQHGITLMPGYWYWLQTKAPTSPSTGPLIPC